MFGNIIRESTTTTGTGNITLGGADTGYATFDSQFSSADRVYYSILTNGGQDREIGYGTFTSPNLLARTAILGTLVSGTYTAAPSATAVTLSGTSTVVCADAAELLNWADAIRLADVSDAGKVLAVDAAGGAVLTDVLSGGTW